MADTVAQDLKGGHAPAVKVRDSRRNQDLLLCATYGIAPREMV